jgi:hypothetical protein
VFERLAYDFARLEAQKNLRRYRLSSPRGKDRAVKCTKRALLDLDREAAIRSQFRAFKAPLSGR